MPPTLVCECTSFLWQLWSRSLWVASPGVLSQLPATLGRSLGRRPFLRFTIARWQESSGLTLDFSSNLSKTTWWSSRQAGADEKNVFDQYGRVAMLALRRHAFDQYGRVAKLALKRRRIQWHFPWEPTLEPSNKERAPTQELALSKRNVFRPCYPVFALAWLAAPVCSFPRPGRGLFLSFFLFLLLFLSIGRGRHVPSLWREGHRVKREGTDRNSSRYWAPTRRTFALSGHPPASCFDVLGLWLPASEVTKSAGHMVVCVVTGQMVGGRRSPGRQYWGSGPSTSCANHRF